MHGIIYVSKMQSNSPFKILIAIGLEISHTKPFTVVTFNHYELGWRVDG